MQNAQPTTNPVSRTLMPSSGPSAREYAFARLAEDSIKAASAKLIWGPRAHKLVDVLAGTILVDGIDWADVAVVRKLRGHFSEVIREEVVAGRIEGMDRVRDMHRILFAPRWPTLAERCDLPDVISDVYDAVVQVKRLCEKMDWARLETFLEDTFAEIEGSYAYPANGLFSREMQRLKEGTVRGAMIMRDAIFVPLYDDRRVRLVSASDLGHALRFGVNGSFHQCGCIFGQVGKKWAIVGYD